MARPSVQHAGTAPAPTPPPSHVAAALTAARPTRNRLSAPRSPAASTPPIPPSLILNSSHGMGKEGRNGDVSGPTTPYAPGDLGGLQGVVEAAHHLPQHSAQHLGATGPYGVKRRPGRLARCRPRSGAQDLELLAGRAHDQLQDVVQGEPQFTSVLHAACCTTSPWLFPGGQPGRPISAWAMGERLRKLGIRLAETRSTALFQLATELPAAVLARTLGIDIIVAVKWQRARRRRLGRLRS